jgi:hypothetical protein
MSASKLMLGLALAGLTLSGCNKEDNTKPVSTPNPPTTAHSRQVPSTEPSATGGTDTASPTTAPIALPPVIPGAGGPVTQPSTRPTGSSGSGTGSSGSSSSGTGSSGTPGGGSDLNK